jgi:ABC-2 type transport system ATP-binding protein
MTQQPAIQVTNLVKKFGSFVANDRLTFEVNRGEIFGFLGANGAGKTTTIKILCGLSAPTSGSAYVAGIDVVSHPDWVKKNIGYMSQRFSMYEDMTITENIFFYAGIYGMGRQLIKSRTEQLLNEFGIEHIRNTLIRDIPIGWRQKLAFLVAVFHDPPVVFLDEPTAGVDPLARRQFWNLIYNYAARNNTVFVTTHYMDEAEYCDRICILSEGKIAAIGSPEELKEQWNAPSMEKVFLRIARPNLNKR